jgi:hypothetical protein
MTDPDLRERALQDDPRRMQRLRVGITGLAAVLLVVLVATAIATGIRRSAENTAAVAPPPVVATATPASNAADEPSEPLAQLGAAPGTVPDEPTTNGQAPARQ